MRRKILSIGSSKGLFIPADYLRKLDLRIGAEIDVTLDEDNNRIIIEPLRKKKCQKSVNHEFVVQVNKFI